MELVIAIAASLAAPLAPAIAHGAPFFPGPEPVDHVVTMVVRNWGLEEGRVVTHHGGWTRVERSHRGGLGRSYFGQSGFTTVNLGGLNPGENRGVSIVRGAEAHLSFGWDYSSFKTGERRAVLGESCEVWNVSRTIRDSELANFSCVTADGIELASWLVTPRGIRHSAEATHLERRPVLPEDAQPPRGLLDLRSWMVPADAAASPESPGPEYDVVLETAIEPGPSTRTKNMRITRRNPNWMLNDTWRGNGRDLSIRHLATGLHVTAHSTTRGVFERLTIDKGPGPIEAIGPGAHAIAERQSETILGESCAWYNVTPGMADGGLHQCWTDDGIVLKEKRYSREAGKPSKRSVSKGAPSAMRK